MDVEVGLVSKAAQHRGGEEGAEARGRHMMEREQPGKEIASAESLLE